MSASRDKSSVGTTFKFVSSDGGRRKRQQSQRACETCRKRKKRCHHTEAAPQPSPAAAHSMLNSTRTLSQSLPTVSPSNASQVTPIEQPSLENQQIQRGEHLCDGHLHESPQSSVINSNQGRNLQRANKESPGIQAGTSYSVPAQDKNSRFIGDLNPEGIFLAATSPDATRGLSSDSVGVWLNINSALSRRGPQAPPPALQSPSNLFYASGSLVQKVLVPMLEQESLSNIPSPGRLEALSKIYFERVHPILPFVDERALSNLDVTDPGRILLQQGICLAASKNFSARKYLSLSDSSTPLSCREFGDKISGAMRMSIELGLVTNKLVLIQALALMSQFVDNPVGEDLSSQLCGRAVHHLQSLGLHLKGQQDDYRDQFSTTLLCCVWAIDRLNAALNGRPVLMHERDARKDMEFCFSQQKPCFRLFLQITVLLDKTIELYRPSDGLGDPPGLNWSFPAFEDVVLRSGDSHIGTSALATIETLYHAIAILSCRSKTWADPQRSSMAYLRQSLSVSIIGSTVSRELQDQLVLFPFVPYAMSLSLSVAYREMRHSKLHLHRARSRVHFQTICDALFELEGTFWSAATTSDMGKKLLREMDRVFSTVSGTEKRPQQCGNNSLGGIGNGDQVRPASHSPNYTNSLGTRTPTNGSGQVPNQMIQDFDSSIFDSMADIDLFGMFDPAFDLEGFDACLEGNLNPAFPSTFP